MTTSLPVLAVVAVLALGAEPRPATTRAGFDAPSIVKAWTVGHSRYEGRDIVTTCRAWDDFALVETIDPGRMGPVDMTLRERTRTPLDPEQICAEQFGGKATPVAANGYRFHGLRGRFFVLDSPDSFGAEIEFAVIDGKTGHEVFHGMRIMLDPLQLSTEKPMLRFTRSLRADCDPRRPACLAALRAREHIPAAVALDVTRCQDVGTGGGDTQVGVPVHVDDLDKPALAYDGGLVSCFPAP